MKNKEYKTALSFGDYYLEYSIRAGAYASNLFFGSIIVSFLLQVTPNHFLKSILVWTYGIILYEGIWQLIVSRYKPNFKKMSEAVAQGLQHIPGLTVFGDRVYEHVLKMERLIRQICYYYALQLLMTLALYSLGYVHKELGVYLWDAISGGALLILNYFGVALLMGMADSTDRVDFKLFAFMSIIGMVFVVPLLIYIVYAFQIFYS